MTQRNQTISVTIITKNEADRIEDCLQSVANWADEIIILDSGSTDDTVSIAQRYTDKIFVTDWPGYGPQKQRALDKASCDWVFSLDADERLTPELRQDIDKALSHKTEYVAFEMPWAVTVYGKRLDFGRSARDVLKFFRRQGGSFSPDQVHEHIIPAPGKTGKLNGRLLHFTHRDYGHALYKNAHYAWLGAQKRHAAKKRGGGPFIALLRAAWTFFHIYILRLGFLDGRIGLISAALYAQVSFNKYVGLWTLNRQKHQQEHRHTQQQEKSND